MTPHPLSARDAGWCRVPPCALMARADWWGISTQRRKPSWPRGPSAVRSESSRAAAGASGFRAHTDGTCSRAALPVCAGLPAQRSQGWRAQGPGGPPARAPQRGAVSRARRSASLPPGARGAFWAALQYGPRSALPRSSCWSAAHRGALSLLSPSAYELDIRSAPH